MKKNKVDIIAQNWREQIITSGKQTIELLYPYSKINLKKKKNLRKFRKCYHRYVNMDLVNEYWGLVAFTMIYKSNLKMLSLDLPVVEPFNDNPKIELIYLGNAK